MKRVSVWIALNPWMVSFQSITCFSSLTAGRCQFCSACGSFLCNTGVSLLLVGSKERLQWLWLVGCVTLARVIITKPLTNFILLHIWVLAFWYFHYSRPLLLTNCLSVLTHVPDISGREGLTLGTWVSGFPGLWCCWWSVQVSSPTPLCSRWDEHNTKLLSPS